MLDPGDFRKLPHDFTNKQYYLGVAWYIHLRTLVKRELKSSQIQLSIFKQISNLKNSCTYYPTNFHLLLLHFYSLLIYEKASVAYQNLVFKADLVQSHTTWHKGKNVPHIIFPTKLYLIRWRFVGVSVLFILFLQIRKHPFNDVFLQCLINLILSSQLKCKTYRKKF